MPSLRKEWWISWRIPDFLETWMRRCWKPYPSMPSSWVCPTAEYSSVKMIPRKAATSLWAAKWVSMQEAWVEHHACRPLSQMNRSLKQPGAWRLLKAGLSTMLCHGLVGWGWVELFQGESYHMLLWHLCPQVTGFHSLLFVLIFFCKEYQTFLLFVFLPGKVDLLQSCCQLQPGFSTFSKVSDYGQCVKKCHGQKSREIFMAFFRSFLLFEKADKVFGCLSNWQVKFTNPKHVCSW